MDNNNSKQWKAEKKKASRACRGSSKRASDYCLLDFVSISRRHVFRFLGFFFVLFFGIKNLTFGFVCSAVRSGGERGPALKQAASVPRFRDGGDSCLGDEL